MYAAEARSFAARQRTGAQDKATTHEIRSTRTRSHTHGHGRRRLTQRAARAKTDGWVFGRSRARWPRDKDKSAAALPRARARRCCTVVSSGAARHLPVLRCCTVPSPSSGAARAVSVCHAPAGSPAPNTRAARSERAREPSEASVPMHVSLAAGTVSAGRLCGPCGFWIFVATSSSNSRSRARPALREDGVESE